MPEHSRWPSSAFPQSAEQLLPAEEFLCEGAGKRAGGCVGAQALLKCSHAGSSLLFYPHRDLVCGGGMLACGGAWIGEVPC
ncbi:MAG TPA: hypothetical protein VGP18_03325 [Solirubrobacteraceae bacterium]|nr:hypothetical protein [Solirubrobacteraceae bacterium]